MANDGIGLTVLDAATRQPVVYVGEPATLSFTLTNQTGADVGLLPGGAGKASELDVYMPLFYDAAQLAAMSISLEGWTFAFDPAKQALTLTYAGSGTGTWSAGGTIAFDVTGAESDASPTTDTVQVNLLRMTGSVPPQVTAPLALNDPPQPGNAKLTDVLQLSLDAQGSVFVSQAGDPLRNMLTLNVKNTGSTPLYDGSAPRGGTPTVTVAFVYGSTSGALAPDDDRDAPPVGSAWNIVAAVRYPEGNDWTAKNPSPSSSAPHPSWVLGPANTNPGIIGTGASANVSFSFSEVISFTPPGHTQMMVQFTGFAKDEKTKYDDAVFVLDVVKQSPPPTRGLVSFFSPQPLYSVTEPTEPVDVPLRWTMFDVARVNLLTSYPGMPATVVDYPNPARIAYDSATVTIPGVTQDMAVTATLQAYDGNGGYLNSTQFTAFVQARMFVDPRDGKVYPVVQLAQRFWMAANLDYAAPSGSAFYGDNAGNEQPYGRLYTRAAAVGAPTGWRLPSQADWQALFAAYDSPQAAYAALVAGGASGFAAQLGGRMDDDGGSSQLGTYGFYWSSTASAASDGVYAGFSGNSKSVNVGATLPGGYLLSVRYCRDVG